jgi:PTH1 family peptidyl-tRNA hydrolase
MALFQRFQRNDQLIQVTQDIPVASVADESFIKLIVGLGNVGKDYDGTRHNVGFAVVDEFRKKNKFPAWQEKSKFKAFISEDFLDGKKVILAKPTTLMNASGDSVRALKDFYKLDNKDIVVVHDELDLPFETVKQKMGGGSAGNNGLKSLISQIGEDFSRIRIGIKNELLERMDAADFVLSKFSKEELPKLKNIVSDACKLLD